MAVIINMTETQIDMMDYSSGEESSTTASEIETFQEERRGPPGQLETGGDETRGHVYLPTHPPESNQDANIKLPSPPGLIRRSDSVENLSSQNQEEDDEGDTLSTPAWSYREQFKQLYSLSDEPDRKEFLDKLFAFMQQKNTPISRIPIMAKQPLDLYKLSKLVVERGGLLEVIRRKAWREIAKALDLPASITSAAFTLRTQYLKYLYPYECAMEKLSQPQEIKDAIEGNKRDRRISTDIDLNEFTTSPPTTNNRMEGAVLIRSVENPAVTPTCPTGAVQIVHSPLTALSPSVSAYSIISGPQGTYIPTPHMTVGPHGTPIPLVVTPTPLVRPMIPSTSSSSPPNSGKLLDERTNLTKRHPSPSYSNDSVSPPAKKLIPNLFDQKKQALSSMPFANITIRPNRTSNTTSTAGMGFNISNMTENSLVVSIDVNGVMYQGVLFAKPSNSSNGNIGPKNP